MQSSFRRSRPNALIWDVLSPLAEVVLFVLLGPVILILALQDRRSAAVDPRPVARTLLEGAGDRP